LVQQFLLLKGSFLQYPEHLWLYVDSKYPAGITAPFCKLAGKNSRAAAEIQHEITGLNKPFCKAVMPIKKPAGAGIKKAVFGCGGCFMMTGTRSFFNNRGWLTGIFSGNHEKKSDGWWYNHPVRTDWVVLIVSQEPGSR
jgi:hypothetical protein